MDNKFKLFFTRDSKEVTVPSYAHEDDAGMDIAAKEGGTLKPGEYKLFKSGIRVAVPHGVVMDVRPRSGLAAKHGVTVLNGPGTVDAGYTGDVGVILINLGTEDFVVEPGDRIAQLVFLPVLNAVLFEAKSLNATDRGTNGMGSTGVK